jgi:hypothetical protein
MPDPNKKPKPQPEQGGPGFVRQVADASGRRVKSQAEGIWHGLEDIADFATGKDLPGGFPHSGWESIQQIAKASGLESSNAPPDSKPKPKPPKPNKPHTPTSELPKDIAQALSPYSNVLNELPGDYQSAIQSIVTSPNEQLPNNVEMPANLPPGVQGTEQGLTNAINQATEATMKGTQGIASALKTMPGAVATMAADMPYADVISTMLQQRKNELLYGSTTPLTYKPDTTGWSSNLTNVVKYIEGTGAGTAKTGIGGIGSIEKAITSGQTPTPPGTGGATGIGGG